MMNSSDLKRYLSGVFAIELNIYTLNRTIGKLTDQYHSLAKRKKLIVPQRREPSISLKSCAYVAGIISGLIVGGIGIISGLQSCDGFFDYIALPIAVLINAVGGLIIGGSVLGFAAWVILRAKERKRLEAEFQSRVREYDREVAEQNQRVANERAKQTALSKEIGALKTRLSQAKDVLAKAYAYNILAPEYRNIYAVSSIHGYLTKGRTHCLQFNENTGDQGAYNIYESERRLDQIITNTEEILVRFDQVILYQQDLAMGLRDAMGKVDALCGNVNTQLKRIQGSVSNIERSQGVIAYNSECAARELEFMNWMAVWR